MNRRRMRPLLSSAMMMIVLPTPCPSFSVPRRENNHSPASSRITGTTTDPTWSDLTPSSRLATSALDDGPSRPSRGWMRRRRSEEDDTDNRGVDYADKSGTLVCQVKDDGEYGANDVMTMKTTTAMESSSHCPMSFSMTFPRYRIEYGRSPSSSSSSLSSSRDDRVESDKLRTRRLRRGIISSGFPLVPI